MRPPPFLRPLTAELLVSAPPWADGCMTEDDLLLTWLPKLGLLTKTFQLRTTVHVRSWHSSAEIKNRMPNCGSHH